MPKKQGAFDKKPSPSSLLKEAIKLHRQALKKRGQSSIQLFQKAVAKFECAIVAGLDGDALIEAQTNKGDCFFHWGQRVVANIESTSFELLTFATHNEARLKACELFQTAVESYKQTGKGVGEWDLDLVAAVNCGNTLSTWAEFCEKDHCIPLLQSALQCYRHILEFHRGDLEVQLHLCDVLVQLASAFGEVNRREDGACTFKEAMRSYEDAHQQWTETEAQESCDLAELLLRWGISCLTAFEHSMDKKVKEEYIQKALQLLKESIEADPENAEAFNSLGSAFEASAEMYEGQEALATLQRALQEGYEVAKRLIKDNNDAALGIAEVHLLIGKLYLKQGNEIAAKESFMDSIHRYEKLLKGRSAIGGFHDHSEALYNYACGCALMGKESLARSALELLLQKQGTSVLEIGTDQDLRVLGHLQWFQDLVNKRVETSFD